MVCDIDCPDFVHWQQILLLTVHLDNAKDTPIIGTVKGLQGKWQLLLAEGIYAADAAVKLPVTHKSSDQVSLFPFSEFFEAISALTGKRAEKMVL